MKRERSAGSRDGRIRNSGSHLGIGFEVWTGQRTWFWFVASPRGNGGAIGAAASEADAVREARLSIEQMPAQCRAGAASLRAVAGTTSAPALHQSHSIGLAGWECLLANLDRYLACVSGATA